MKKYSDYSKSKKNEPTEAELKAVRWTKFKIIVPTLKDKKDLIEALRHCHDNQGTEETQSGINADYIPVNQLIHAYLEEDSMIVVNKKLFNSMEA